MTRSIPVWSIRRTAIWATAAAVFTAGASADDILTTSSFTNCDVNNSIIVNNVNIEYNANAKTVTFDVSGTSTKEQNVTATLNVTAYGQQVYSNTFNPCQASTYVEQLCPAPSGTFSAKGTQAIPSSYADKIPSIAFQVPDIAADATLELRANDGSQAGCIESQVTNGKTISIPAVSYIAAGVAGLAFVASGVSAAAAAFGGAGAHAGGTGTMSPSFTEMFGVFQGFAMNGMMSVNYPAVYRSFSKNFAFSTGLIPWTSMQLSIDQFRNVTGGNLTTESVEYLRNATLVWPDGTTSTANSSVLKRSIEDLALAAREITTSADSTTTTSNAVSGTERSIREAVSGIKGYAEQLSVPSANTFMTVLLIVAIVIGVIIIGILFLKVILETWALFGSFPEGLKGFRKHYWGSIARTVTQLILLLYGTWVLYCIYQFTHGDSWAAKTLAGVTLGLFTGILAFFAYNIWSIAQKLKEAEGDASSLYQNKDIWVKYSLFYDSYKKDYWWLFVPAILYMLAKGCVLAMGDGHGMAQTITQLVIEALMLCLLLWSRPYERKASNVINICVAVVRVLSVICILVFVEEFGIAQTTQTVTGVILIAVQSALTGILAILIMWNAIMSCIKENPHRKRRKELEKMQREQDTLTPLDARNSLLMDQKSETSMTFSMSTIQEKREHPYQDNLSERTNPYASHDAYHRPTTPVGVDQSRQSLIGSAAPIDRQPSVPNLGYGNGYNGGYNNAGYGGYAPYRAPGGH